MNPSKIRPASSGDLPAIKTIIDATELFPSEYLDDMFSPAPSPEDDQEFWLTYDDGKPGAVAYCAPERMTNGTWNLLLIAVHPERQSTGIGRRIMQFVEDTLRTRGVRVLLVETSGLPEYARTRSFYQQIGYEQEACIREYYDKGDDKIVFRNAL